MNLPAKWHSLTGSLPFVIPLLKPRSHLEFSRTSIFDSMASTSSATTSSSMDVNANQNFSVPPTLSQPQHQHFLEPCSELQGLMPTTSHFAGPLFSQSDVWMGDGPSSHNTRSVLSLNLDVDRCLKEWEEKQSLKAVSGRSIGRQINRSTNSMLVTVPTSLPSPLANNDRLFVAPASKTLKFVLEKQLTKSDASTSCRIILPKKQAEAKLPTLNDKWGITLIVRDALSSDKWKMNYRFWPNNNSKMYVLENTGGFIRKYKLKFGDYIAIYQDNSNENYICARKIDGPPFPLELDPYTEDGRMGDNQTTTKSSEHLEIREQTSSMCNISASSSLEMASTRNPQDSSDDGLGVEDDLIDFRRQPTFDDLDLSFFDSSRPGDYLSNRSKDNK